MKKLFTLSIILAMAIGGTESSDCVLAGFTIRNGQRGKPLYVDIQAENGDVEPEWVEWLASSGQELDIIDLKLTSMMISAPR